MPGFNKDATHHYVSVITGPSHVILGLALTRDHNRLPPTLLRRPAIGQCGHAPLDEAQIRTAVLAGINEANQHAQSHWHATEIVYIEDDTPRYTLYQHCAKLLVQRLNDGGPWGSMLPPRPPLVKGHHP